MSDFWAGLIKPMEDRPCVSRSEKVRQSPPQWPPRKDGRWKRLDVPVIANPWDMTPMQCAVMNLRTQGCTYRVIAEKLEISEKTVWSHMDIARGKTQADSMRHSEQMWGRWVRAQREAN